MKSASAKAVILLALINLGCSATDEKSDSSSEHGQKRTQEDTDGGAEGVTREEIIEAREAAWIAEMDAFSAPRSPENDALPETMSGPELLHAVFSLLWNYGIEKSYSDDWTLDVQSVTLSPSNETAWLETCISYHVTTIAPSRNYWGEPGWVTIQKTEVMESFGDGEWKLALSLPNQYSQDEAGCPTPSEGEKLSDSEIIDMRKTAEMQYLEALASGQIEDLDNTHSGYVREQLERLRPDHICPGFPPVFRDQENRLPSYFDSAWDSTYEVDWRSREIKYSDDEPDFMGGVSFPKADISECLTPYGYAFMPVRDMTQYPQGPGQLDGAISEVSVQQITWSDDISAVYLETCREIYFPNGAHTPYADPDKEIDATIKATEVMKLEENSWKITGRWNLSIEADSTICQ